MTTVNQETNPIVVTDKDLRKVWYRTNLVQGSLNFERYHALGIAYCMNPVLKKIYPENNQARKDAIKRNLEFFNSQPFMDTVIIGINAAMEEQKANGADISDETFGSIKVGLMGPLAGIGDPLWWGTYRPLVSSIFASMAATGSILAPILFFIVFNAGRLAFTYWGVTFGYRKGTDIIRDIASGTLKKITTIASIVGLFIMGCLINAWVNINIPLKLMESTNPQTGEITALTVQSVLDSILPGIVPLLATLFVMKLLKKNVKSIYIILAIFVIGIAGYALGIFA